MLQAIPSHLAVLGHPIHHSRSPRIHRAAYAELGLPWKYTAVRVAESQLAAFLSSRGSEWRGFSVTMPLKIEAHRLCTVRDPMAEESGVVNTLLRLTDTAHGPQWAGFNTDVAGLAAALQNSGLTLTRVVVLGAGATAVSAVLAARHLGATEVTILARRGEAAAQLAARFDGTSGTTSDQPPLDAQGGAWESTELDERLRPRLARATAVISTLPGTVGTAVPLLPELTTVPLFDVAYDPWPSPLARRWAEAGGESHAGIDMLIEQALVQVRIFVGGDPSFHLQNESHVLAVMRDAGVGR